MSGYPDNNPKTARGALKIPMDLVPPALAKGAAEAFANGASKYGPYNWREKMISSSVYFAAVKRHLDDWWDRVDHDDCAPDSHVHHLKHAAACIGMLLDTMNSPLLNDNRPPRVNHNGENSGRPSERSCQDVSEAGTGVLAHAGAERDGKSEPGFPRLPAGRHHTGHGGEEGGPIRRGRDQGSGQTLDAKAKLYRECY